MTRADTPARHDLDSRLAAWARATEPSAIQDMLSLKSSADHISLALGLPAVELFPARELAEAARSVLLEEPGALQYGTPYEPLKRHVAALMQRRGAPCRPEQVFLTAGAQQGMSLLARVLLEPGAPVVSEERVYTGFQQVVEPFQPDLRTVPTDPRSGMDADAVVAQLERPSRPAFVYVIPDGHNPLAVSLSREKRERLAAAARHFGVPVVEDDPYGLLCYGAAPTPPLRALDEEWVFYVGSFSKILAPALRAGWLVVPEALLPKLAVAKEAADINAAPFTQRVIARLLDTHSLDAHIAGLREAYRTKLGAMLDALERHFPDEARWARPDAGLFVWVELPGLDDTTEALRLAVREEGVAFLPGEAFEVHRGRAGCPGIRLNFSYATLAQIEEGVARLGRVLGRLIAARRGGGRTRRGGHVAQAQSRSRVALGYGRAHVPFDFDPGRFALIEPEGRAEGRAALNDDELEQALRRPIESPPLADIVKPSDRIVIVVPDATRAARVDRLAPRLVAHLRAAGVADRNVSFLIGAGIHRAASEAEIHSLLGPELPGRFAVESHDANAAAGLVELGRTARGTPVELNRRLVECDRSIVVGAISFHYFAGFSGGRKGVLPGCASERAIRANHLLAFDQEKLVRTPGVASGRLDGNPVHEDMLEAVALAAPAFLVNSVVGAGGDIARLYAGHWRAAHRRGCDEYKAGHAVSVRGRRPLVIVSAGGAPRDVNLIQSHKAMEHAAAVLEEGGTMVVLAECGQGLGRDDFLDWFVPGGSRATATKLVSGDYRVNGQTAWGLRLKSERFRIRLVSSLPPDVVRSMGLEPCASIESALEGLSHESGYVLPNGLTTLPQLESEAV